MNPAAIAALTETAPTKRGRAAGKEANPKGASRRAPIADRPALVRNPLLQRRSATTIANETASERTQPIALPPLVSKPKVSRTARCRLQPIPGEPLADSTIAALAHDNAIGNTNPRASRPSSQPISTTPHEDFTPYTPSEYRDKIIDRIITLHRLRQGMIKAQTKLTLQAMASLRFAVAQDGDWDNDEAKAKARKRADDLYRLVAKDPTHELHIRIMPYIMAIEPLTAQRTLYEKDMVREAKRLPVYPFVKSVSGFGDISFATIVGECGDIGTYKSIAAVWKRLGLAVFDGKRQGNPGAGAVADDWIRHGYNKQRRSVSWNARAQIIGGMGLWRPEFGSDLADATYYQRVFAERARYESDKLGTPVTESAKGKESYKKHATNRAMRYTEKRLLRELYKSWRRA
jgi:hypothetical protein